MTDIKISETIRLLKYEIANLEASVSFNSTGEVIKVFDGIAIAFGLEEVQFNEVVIFENNIQGIVFNIEEDIVGILILGEDKSIKEGQKVSRKCSFFQIPVSKKLLGRVINIFGLPIDQKTSIENVVWKKVDIKAPDIISRQSIYEPVQTGIKIIDSLIPIGRGQRELIIGDRQVGKTSIAIDTILNQKKLNKLESVNNKLYCIYVSIGQKKSSVARIIKKLKDFGALEYSIIVLSSASDPVPLQFYAPYVGCTIGEFFRDRGMHAIIIYDDLSKHAVSYRQISLLLRRPPGREAYPGDIFYIHSKLLERAAKLSREIGGGSLTALPIVETQEGDLSSYIPTNIISITDGQIFLEKDLFHKGIKPAINVGLSVSRIGSAAQVYLMKKVAGTLKLDLAQYREKQSFSQFTSNLDTQTKELLQRGAKLTELLKQDLCCPVPIEEQIVSIFAGVKGFLKDIKLKNINKFECGLLNYIKSVKKSLLNDIKRATKMTHKLEQSISDAINSFLLIFLQ
jgi:F-type H+-transporting ATPase subunit alpha